MCIIIMSTKVNQDNAWNKPRNVIGGKNGRNPKEYKNAENFLKKFNINNLIENNIKKPKPKPITKNRLTYWEQELKKAKTKKDIRKIFLQASKELHPNKRENKKRGSIEFNKIFKLYTNLSQRT